MSDAGDTGRGRPLNQMREPGGRNFANYMAEGATVTYADGIAGMAGGASISNLDFYVIVEQVPDNDPALGVREIREVRLRIKLPTFALLEGLANLIVAMQPTLEALQNASDENTRALATQIQRLRAMNVGR
jgi:hypothetical protein